MRSRKARSGHRAGSTRHRRLERIRQAARSNKKERFTALGRHVTMEALVDAFYAIAKNAAAGIDGVSASVMPPCQEGESPSDVKSYHM